jgi:hypothetical protein
VTWLVAFLLTLAIEVPLAVLLAPRGLRRRVALDATLLNTFTHPLLTVALRWGVTTFWPGEALVWAVEALGYRVVTRLPVGRAVLISTVANGATVLLALILRG